MNIKFSKPIATCILSVTYYICSYVVNDHVAGLSTIQYKSLIGKILTNWITAD